MIVATYGAWYRERSGFSCSGSLDEFVAAGKDLGRALAQIEARVIITSYTDYTIDGYVAEGYLEALKSRGRNSVPVEPVEPPLVLIKSDPRQQDGDGEGSDTRFGRLFTENGRFVTYASAQGLLRFNRHLTGIRMADAIVTIGGADHSFLAGEVARHSAVPLVPVGSFGGASAKLLQEVLHDTEDPVKKGLYGQLLGPWCETTKHAVMDLLRERTVVIVHGRADDWRIVRDAIADASTSAAKFRPAVLQEQVDGAEVLSKKWESIASHACAAIAVITPDDVGGIATNEERVFRARQNVWLEVGWVWGRLTRKRLLLLMRRDVEIPSDFGGVTYYRYNEHPNEKRHEIQDFLRQLA